LNDSVFPTLDVYAIVMFSLLMSESQKLARWKVLKLHDVHTELNENQPVISMRLMLCFVIESASDRHTCPADSVRRK
jgi:hypothetical protein